MKASELVEKLEQGYLLAKNSDAYLSGCIYLYFEKGRPEVRGIGSTDNNIVLLDMIYNSSKWYVHEAKIDDEPWDMLGRYHKRKALIELRKKKINRILKNAKS